MKWTSPLHPLPFSSFLSLSFPSLFFPLFVLIFSWSGCACSGLLPQLGGKEELQFKQLLTVRRSGQPASSWRRESEANPVWRSDRWSRWEALLLSPALVDKLTICAYCRPLSTVLGSDRRFDWRSWRVLFGRVLSRLHVELCFYNLTVDVTPRRWRARKVGGE